MVLKVDYFFIFFAVCSTSCQLLEYWNFDLSLKQTKQETREQLLQSQLYLEQFLHLPLLIFYGKGILNNQVICSIVISVVLSEQLKFEVVNAFQIEI